MATDLNYNYYFFANLVIVVGNVGLIRECSITERPDAVGAEKQTATHKRRIISIGPNVSRRRQPSSLDRRKCRPRR